MGGFSPETSHRFFLSKLNCFICMELPVNSSSSMQFRTAAEKTGKNDSQVCSAHSVARASVAELSL